MNIQKLNPIGYETKTEKGNTYKKSNIGATVGLVTMATVNAVPYIFKNNAKVQTINQFFTMAAGLKSFFPKASPKMVKGFTIAGIALDLVFGLVTGQWIDKKINAKRAAKADDAAETAKKNNDESEKINANA